MLFACVCTDFVFNAEVSCAIPRSIPSNWIGRQAKQGSMCNLCFFTLFSCVFPSSVLRIHQTATPHGSPNPVALALIGIMLVAFVARILRSMRRFRGPPPAQFPILRSMRRFHGPPPAEFPQSGLAGRPNRDQC
eukprot:7655605-Heterocapsa_arctica.AAC.1